MMHFCLLRYYLCRCERLLKVYLSFCRFSTDFCIFAAVTKFASMIGKNNPLNIRYSIFNRWRGQSGSKRGFCEFTEMQYGIRAACILLMRTYRKKGAKTIRQVVTRFAPPSENNTENYISFVCRQVGMSPDEEIRQADYPHIISAMSYMEVGFADFVTVPSVAQVIIEFSIKVA